MFENIKNKITNFYSSNERLLDLYQISDRKINKLILKFNTDYYLINRKCPHNGLPLTNSTLSNDLIICNWHGCRFSIFPNEIIPRENIIEHFKLKKEDFDWLNNELSN